MTKTINGLTVTTSAAAGDLLLIWRAANNDTRKITKANFMGGVLTGAGTIATGGFTLTVGGTSTINGSVVGNMTGSGTVATGGNTLTVSGTSTINGSLVGSMTGSGTVATGGNTLTVAGTSSIAGTLSGAGFTLTVPATGTASLLGTAQTYSALKTFSAGLTFGQTTLNWYEEGNWTPVLADASSGGNLATGTFVGTFTRKGNEVTAHCMLSNIVSSGMTAGNTLHVRGLPYACRTLTNYQASCVVKVSRITFTGYVVASISSGLQYVTFQEFAGGANAENNLIVSDDTGNGFGDLYFSLTYQV